MTRKFVNRYCAGLPCAQRSDPWGGGHDAWKVGGKLFAVIGAIDEAVSIKCRDVESAGLLIESGLAERAPYFHRSWVRISLGPKSPMQQDELGDRLLASYRLIRDSLPKTFAIRSARSRLATVAGGHNPREAGSLLGPAIELSARARIPTGLLHKLKALLNCVDDSLYERLVSAAMLWLASAPEIIAKLAREHSDPNADGSAQCSGGSGVQAPI